MASTTTHRLLLLRRQTHPSNQTYYPLHYFSSSSENPPNPNSEPPTDSTAQPQPGAKPSLSSFLNEVKSNLQREPRTNSGFSPRHSQSGSSLLEITRNLSEFRRRTAAPPPPSSGEEVVSMQELYKRNVLPNSRGPSASFPSSAKPSFDAIRGCIKNIRASTQTSNDQKPIDRTPSFSLGEILKQQGGSDQNKGLGSGPMMGSMFGKEAGSTGSDEEKDSSLKFLRIYNYDELGQKLRTLRPGKTKGKWFTFRELKDRLVKLSEIEKESKNRLGLGGVPYMELRESLFKIGSQDKEDKKKRMRQPLNVIGLGQLGGVPSYMSSPPKDELVEKYFHPDNMSSAEKIKLELKKVRDEFKLSESDCGSARVQVAQLTTKIKHLSSVLHKKDKHSRHGLQAMVQKRKKLLKYLRRTDWDSYCLVLSKLGLRDNPVIKA